MSAIKMNHHVTACVVSVCLLTQRVRLYELADPDGWHLPPFTAGAHLDLITADGLVRQYSLLGDPAQRDRYWIAIQREDEGRGGSLAFHRMLEPGSVVALSLPRNHFALAPAARHSVLLAGGIGITPILSMIHALRDRGESFEVHFAARRPELMPLADQVAELAGERAFFYFSDDAAGPQLDLGSLLAKARGQGVHAYCCGPTGMVAAAHAAAADWPEGHFHAETFGAAAALSGTLSYTLELARTGGEVFVAEGQSMLEALRIAGVELPSSCEAGICLACRIPYLEGSVVHRDLLMKADERRGFLTPCVSGCSSARLVLDL